MTPRNYFINQENNISCPRLLSLAARTFFRMEDAVNTCVKAINLLARIKAYTEKNVAIQNTKITSRFSYSHQDMK